MYSLTNKYQVNRYVIIFQETTNTSEVMCSSPITMPSLFCRGNYYLDFGNIHSFFFITLTHVQMHTILTFYFEVILDFQNSCKDNTKLPYFLHRASSNGNISYTYGFEELILVQNYKLQIFIWILPVFPLMSFSYFKMTQCIQDAYYFLKYPSI